MLQVLQSTFWTEENVFTSKGINIIYSFIMFLKKNKTTDNIKVFFHTVQSNKSFCRFCKGYFKDGGGKGDRGSLQKLK